MCKSTDQNGGTSYLQKEGADRLKIRAFCVRLSISEAQQPLPESITLLYLPRISESPLEINDSKIRSDLPAFVTLHRVRSAEQKSSSHHGGEVVFASGERVRASEGVRFEVYLRDEKLLKGIFRRDINNEKDKYWNLDCKCALESEVVGLAIAEAAVCLMCDEHVAISEKVDMVIRRRRRKTCKWLEEIPEEREIDVESDGCACFDDAEMEVEIESQSTDCEENMEIEMEGVGWAVDVGIWVMCLGVGYLVSKASSKRLRRRRIS